MTPQERDVLLPLLDRLRQTRVGDKDADADQLIRQAVQAQPDAPYILAQTVLMQDYALHAAQDRIHALEQQLSQSHGQEQRSSGGGFLGSLFGGRSATPAPPSSSGYGQGGPQSAQPTYGPQIANAVQPGAGQPSFLHSAAQTAAGIAGGALLFQGLEGLFGSHGGFGGAGFLGGMGGIPGHAPLGGPVENVTNNYYDQPGPDVQAGARGEDRGAVADQTNFDDGGSFEDRGSDSSGDDFSGDDSFNA